MHSSGNIKEYMKYLLNQKINRRKIKHTQKKGFKMNCIISFLFLVLYSNIVVYSQVNINVGSQKTIGGNWTDIGVDLKKINSGYAAIIRSSSPISNDRTIGLKGSSDYWLVGLDNNLLPIWQNSYGGDLVDDVFDMVVTKTNEILLVGISNSSISANKTVANYGGQDVWVVCTDSAGNIKWQNVYGGTNNEYFSASILQLENGNYVIGTSSISGISGSKTENGRGDWDYWIFSIDSAGNQLWDKTFGGSKHDRLSEVLQISESELIISGVSSSPISGDKSENRINPDTNLLTWEGRDLWIIKYDFITNQIIWDKTFGGIEEEGMSVFTAFDDTSIYIITSSLSGISGTKTTANFGYGDIWLNKIDTSGNSILQLQLGGTAVDAPSSITNMNDGTLLIGASSDSPISGIKTENPIGGYYSDYWLISIDVFGNVLWDKTIGGSDGDWLSSIYIENKNHYVIIGSSISGVSGHKTEPLRGNVIPGQEKSDTWIVELFTTVGIGLSMDYANRVKIYPNPASDVLNIQLIENTSLINNIRILDLLSNIILEKQINSQQTQLKVSSLASGIYIIEGYTEKGEVFREKFVRK